MKKIIALGMSVLIILVTIVGCDENEIKNNDNNAYLPHIMFDEVLYRLSPNRIDSYILNAEELQSVGSVESVINGTSFPQENLQVNGLTDLLDCNIYTTDFYPKHLFILKNDGGYVAFVEENNNAAIAENLNGSGVEMIVNSIMPREGITITLENKTDNEYTFGSDFALYVNENNSWEAVQPIIDNWGFNSIGYDIAPQSTTEEIFIDWAWLYGELPGGNYRIQKEILLVRSPGDYDKYLLEAEFSIPGNINTGLIELNEEKFTLVRSSGNVQVRYVDNTPDMPLIESALAEMTEDELFNMYDTEIFSGTIQSVRNLEIDFNGDILYKGLATILVDEVFRGSCVPGDIVSILLENTFNTNMWVSDNDVTEQFAAGMAGIFMPLRYDETSPYSFHERNNAKICWLDLAPYRFLDGTRYAFLETQDGLLFDRHSYKNIRDAPTLYEVKQYINIMLGR